MKASTTYSVCNITASCLYFLPLGRQIHVNYIHMCTWTTTNLLIITTCPTLEPGPLKQSIFVIDQPLWLCCGSCLGQLHQKVTRKSLLTQSHWHCTKGQENTLPNWRVQYYSCIILTIDVCWPNIEKSNTQRRYRRVGINGGFVTLLVQMYVNFKDNQTSDFQHGRFNWRLRSIVQRLNGSIFSIHYGRTVQEYAHVTPLLVNSYMLVKLHVNKACQIISNGHWHCCFEMHTT